MPLGLKTITADSNFEYRPHKLNCVERILVAPQPPPYLLPSTSFMELEDEEDAIEDVVEVEEEEEEEEDDDACWAKYSRRGPGRRLPPPIPLLARTGKLTCRMPWVLKRIYEDDGRLVIREVRGAKRHEYFRARRRDGRLTLQLMELADHHSVVLAEKVEKETTAAVDSDIKN